MSTATRSSAEHPRGVEEAPREHRQATLSSEVEDSLQRARKLLYDLNARLTFFPPEIRATYSVDGFGELTGLQQTDYRLEFPPGGRRHPLSMHYVCRGEGELLRQVVAARAVIAQQEDFLRQHGLTFTVSHVFADTSARDARAGGPAQVAFHLAAVVPVSLVFDVDPQAGGLRLTTWNLERLGRASYPLRPEAVDGALLGELEKAILREPNRLNALAGFRVSEDVRGRLQERLHLDGRRKAVELQDGQARSRRGGLLARLLGLKDPAV